jgi:hypothetical protein
VPSETSFGEKDMRMGFSYSIRVMFGDICDIGIVGHVSTSEIEEQIYDWIYSINHFFCIDQASGYGMVQVHVVFHIPSACTNVIINLVSAYHSSQPK